MRGIGSPADRSSAFSSRLCLRPCERRLVEEVRDRTQLAHAGTPSATADRVRRISSVLTTRWTSDLLDQPLGRSPAGSWPRGRQGAGRRRDSQAVRTATSSAASALTRRITAHRPAELPACGSDGPRPVRVPPPSGRARRRPIGVRSPTAGRTPAVPPSRRRTVPG